MEDQRTNPVVVARQRFDADAIGAEDLDLLVATTGGEVLGAARRSWWFLQTRHRGKVLVRCCRGEGAAFDYVLVGKERLLEAVAFGL